MIIGRDAELEEAAAFVAEIARGPSALVVEGEPGIGKSALWHQVLADAAARSYQVLACRPIESEAQLAYAALGDLLADVPDSALDVLPSPQRRALDVALMRREPEDEEQSVAHAVALGLLGVLQAISGQRPILLAVDDAPWLDLPSARALTFVARRLRTEPVGLLLTRRYDGTSVLPLELSIAADDVAARVHVVHLAPLEEPALAQLLLSRLEGSLTRRDTVRLHSVSGGNPFYALEVGRAMREKGGGRGSVEDPSVPATLHALVGDRLDGLPEAAGEAIRVAAAASRPTTSLIAEVIGGPAAAAGVEAAEAAGVLEPDGERLRFTHPLLASVTYSRMAASARRRLHARLAEVLDDPEERGRHLALAAEDPDAEVAAALDEAAARARARSAPGAAADLWAEARRLTPPDDPGARLRRGTEAAERYFDAGDGSRAAALLQDLIAESPAGVDRARALTRLGWVRAHIEGFGAGEETFRAALAEHSGDVPLRIQIEQGLSWCVHSTTGVTAAEVHARNALAIAEEHGDPAVVAGALAHLAFVTSLKGEGIALEMADRALRTGSAPAWSQILGRPDWTHALLLQWLDELPTAQERFAALYREALDRGDEHSLPHILFHLARVELHVGQWGLARDHARECRETTIISAQAGEIGYSYVIEAMVEAHTGDVDRARALIREGLELSGRAGSYPASHELLAILGFLELSVGDAAAAEAALDEVADSAGRAGFVEPAPFRFHGDHVEAKVSLGKLAEAEALLHRLDALDEVLRRPWLTAVSARGWAMVSAAQGRAEDALAHVDRAMDAHERLGEPFERARTVLLRGSIQRRDRKKRDARDSLEHAASAFREIGAPLWAAKADAELARIGGRAATPGLTPTEERVAELIASGMTYREVADALFISPKTVQWNASSVYRKLGVRSGTELAALRATQRGPRSG